MQKRIVIKLGSAVVMNDQGSLAVERMFELVHVCAKLRKAGHQVLIVSSGAVGLGRKELGLVPPLSVLDKQAAAAVGQSLLMDQYRTLFAASGIVCAQVLLTHHDFSDRQRYNTLREVFNRLLQLGAIPIINENDTVSAAELLEDGQTKSFGDNDRLSALVAGKLECQQLVLLSNVDGVYTDNPHTNPEARLITDISDLDSIKTIGTAGQSSLGRGGMQSKLEAARLAALCGTETIIASGQKEGVLEGLFFSDQPSGTRIHASLQVPARKRWIGMAAGTAGTLVINAGAAKALLEQHASLLPVGIRQIQGNFLANQTVSIVGEDGVELGRGISAYASAELSQLLGKKDAKEAILKDKLVLSREIQA